MPITAPAASRRAERKRRLDVEVQRAELTGAGRALSAGGRMGAGGSSLGSRVAEGGCPPSPLRRGPRGTGHTTATRELRISSRRSRMTVPQVGASGSQIPRDHTIAEAQMRRHRWHVARTHCCADALYPSHTRHNRRGHSPTAVFSDKPRSDEQRIRCDTQTPFRIVDWPVAVPNPGRVRRRLRSLRSPSPERRECRIRWPLHTVGQRARACIAAHDSVAGWRGSR